MQGVSGLKDSLLELTRSDSWQQMHSLAVGITTHEPHMHLKCMSVQKEMLLLFCKIYSLYLQNNLLVILNMGNTNVIFIIKFRKREIRLQITY